MSLARFSVLTLGVLTAPSWGHYLPGGAPGPNPFNPETTLRFQLPEAAPETLTVYNVAGQLVAELASGEILEAGLHERVWSGTDEADIARSLRGCISTGRSPAARSASENSHSSRRQGPGGTRMNPAP